MPGDLGKIKFFPSLEGPFKATVSIEVPFQEIVNEYSIYSDLYSAFSTLKAAYELLETEYSDAVTREESRSVAGIRGTFQAPVEIPVRPCAPTNPPTYVGPDMKWGTGYGTLSVANKEAKFAYLDGDGANIASSFAPAVE